MTLLPLKRPKNGRFCFLASRLKLKRVLASALLMYMLKHFFNNNTNRKETAMAFESEERAKAYWDKNVKLMITLMVIWFVVSFGCGILFVDVLNQFQLG